MSGASTVIMPVNSYRDLRVWQKAMDLVLSNYEVAKQFPQSELYGLMSQIQKAAGSIPANSAEGHGREHLGDYLHHLSMANGSLMELETHFLIAGRLGYLNAEPGRFDQEPQGLQPSQNLTPDT